MSIVYANGSQNENILMGIIFLDEEVVKLIHGVWHINHLYEQVVTANYIHISLF
jgi:hypothetical protein